MQKLLFAHDLQVGNLTGTFYDVISLQQEKGLEPSPASGFV